MSSLADELMNDLDSDSGGEEEQQPIAGPSNGAGADFAAEVAMDAEVEVTDEMVVPEGGVKPTLELDPESVDAMEMSSVAEVGKVAKLAGSKQMKEVLTVRAAALPVRFKLTERATYRKSSTIASTRIPTWPRTTILQSTSSSFKQTT